MTEFKNYCDFVMSGNKISVKTLDLNTDFKIIAKKLDEIADNAFAAHSSDNL